MGCRTVRWTRTPRVSDHSSHTLESPTIKTTPIDVTLRALGAVRPVRSLGVLTRPRRVCAIVVASEAALAERVS